MRSQFHALPSGILSYRVLFILVIGIGLFAAHATPAAAQSSKSQTKICACVQTGLNVLSRNGIPPTALDEIISLLNDPKALTERLGKFGLDQKRADDLQAQLLSLVKKEGLTLGAIEDFDAQGARDLLTRHKIPASELDDLLSLKDDRQATEALLTKHSLDRTAMNQVEDGLHFYEDLSLDKKAHDHLLAHDALEVMKTANLEPTSLKDVLSLLDNQPGLEDRLGTMGLSQDKIREVVTEIELLHQEGLDDKTPATYAAQEALDILFRAGLPSDKYAEILDLRHDDKALASDLSKLGLDQKAIDDFAREMKAVDDLSFDQQHLDDAREHLKETEAHLEGAVDPNGDGKLGGGDQPKQPDLQQPKSGSDDKGSGSGSGSGGSGSGSSGGGGSGSSGSSGSGGGSGSSGGSGSGGSGGSGGGGGDDGGGHK